MDKYEYLPGNLFCPFDAFVITQADFSACFFIDAATQTLVLINRAGCIVIDNSITRQQHDDMRTCH